MAALLLFIAAVLEVACSEGARRSSIGQPGWELAFHIAVATTAFAFVTIGAALAVAQVVVARKLRSVIERGELMDAFLDKHRMREVLETIPVALIDEPELGLLGARQAALGMLPRS